MAYFAKKRKYNSYGYKKGSRSSKANFISKGMKKRAFAMTSRACFVISVRDTITLSLSSSERAKAGILDVAGKIVNSDMHKQLSSVYDQYRIEKVNAKFKLLTVPSTLTTNTVNTINFFTCVDRTGFPANVSLDTLRTYQSYKETSYSSQGDLGRGHWVSIGQTDLVSKSTYYDTKSTAQFPTFAYGVDIGANPSASKDIQFSVELDCQIRYRGVRLDTGSVS